MLEASEVASKHASVQEQQGGTRLILRGRADTAHNGEMPEELLDFHRARASGWSTDHQPLAGPDQVVSPLEASPDRDLDQEGVSRPLTFEGNNSGGAWSDDSQWIYFTSDRGGDRDIWKKPVGGSGRAQVVVDWPGTQFVDTISSDGLLLFVDQATGQGNTHATTGT